MPSYIAILPTNFETAVSRADFSQPSEAATVRTLFRTNKIQLSEFMPSGERIPYIQNNSIEWIVPALFVSASLISENANLVSVGLNVLSNYITDFLKGNPSPKTVKLDVIVERSDGKTYKKISYEGDVSGLISLAEIIKNASSE